MVLEDGLQKQILTNKNAAMSSLIHLVSLMMLLCQRVPKLIIEGQFFKVEVKGQSQWKANLLFIDTSRLSNASLPLNNLLWNVQVVPKKELLSSLRELIRMCEHARYCRALY